MEAEKIRNTTDAELKHQERELNDQLFKLKFQMNMGQTESLKKIRGLRKDIARIKTITRERELGIGSNGKTAAAAVAEPAAPKPTKKAASAAATSAPAAKKKSAGRSVVKKAAKKSEKK